MNLVPQSSISISVGLHEYNSFWSSYFLSVQVADANIAEFHIKALNSVIQIQIFACQCFFRMREENQQNLTNHRVVLRWLWYLYHHLICYLRKCGWDRNNMIAWLTITTSKHRKTTSSFQYSTTFVAESIGSFSRVRLITGTNINRSLIEGESLFMAGLVQDLFVSCSFLWLFKATTLFANGFTNKISFFVLINQTS